ncbi:MAG: phospho-sugar mutase [Clostridia bacterium]|nr:phospho-sugar mutase [Clostridia bacterium]
MEDYIRNYESWLTSDSVDEESKTELRAIEKDEGEKKMRFSSYMEFGTGGLRARMGAGTNMMNTYTVAHATEGVARLIETLGEDAKRRGVIIGRDSRNNSDLFARRSAEVLSSHGIKVYLFDGIRPTPELSFGVRHLGCIAGINITASHNPSAYNGYKLYWEDGSQPTKEMADKVSSFILSTDILTEVPSSADAKEEYIELVGPEIDRVFLENVQAQSVYPDAVKKAADTLKVVYTPLFGAGAKHVPEILRRIGLKHIYPVEEQMTPNGNFPGLSKPNPEYPASFALGIELAEKVGSDLIVATDPDADRVGVMARDKSGEFKCITGNQMGSLLLDYIFTALSEQNKLPHDAYAVKTIVTSEMATAICRSFGVELYNGLTGFKFIAEVIRRHEETGDGTFLLGYEESYGYMKGLYARDKDSVVASMLICEMAAFYSLRGMTLIDAMDALYEKYGYFTEESAEIYMEDADGKEKIAAMMDSLRERVPEELGGEKVVNFRDYDAEKIVDTVTGKVTPTGLPKSNVVYFMTESGNVVVARPSGTEPKIKFYILAKGETSEKSKTAAASCKASLEKLLGLNAGSLTK